MGLDIAYLCTKFDSSSFSRSLDNDWCPPKFKRFMWFDYALFRDDLSSVGLHFLRSACLSNLNSLFPPSTKMWRDTKCLSLQQLSRLLLMFLFVFFRRFQSSLFAWQSRRMLRATCWYLCSGSFSLLALTYGSSIYGRQVTDYSVHVTVVCCRPVNCVEWCCLLWSFNM